MMGTFLSKVQYLPTSKRGEQRGLPGSSQKFSPSQVTIEQRIDYFSSSILHLVDTIRYELILQSGKILQILSNNKFSIKQFHIKDVQHTVNPRKRPALEKDLHSNKTCRKLTKQQAKIQKFGKILIRLDFGPSEKE